VLPPVAPPRGRMINNIESLTLFFDHRSDCQFVMIYLNILF
jgi:hypothetical protein